MSRRKSVLGIAVLFALALSAFGASSASAVGTTAFTCAKANPPKTEFNDPHCLVSSPLGEGYAHVTISSGMTTETSISNSKTASGTTASAPSKLEGTAAGLVTAIQCATISGMGWIENRTNGLAVMYIHGAGKLEYSGCTVTKPSGQGCKVTGGAISTKELTGTTEGLESSAKFTPKEGTEFASISIEGCSNMGLNKTFPVTGSLTVKPTGATLTTTHAEVTTANTLKFAGQKAGLEGSITTAMSTPVADGEAIVAT